MKSVKDIFKVRPDRYTKGLIGIEVEVEGENLPPATASWRVDQDRSLKSAENAEYVLRKPASYVGAIKNLRTLYESLNKEGTAMYESVKAGVHIHINVQDYSLTELFNFVTTYLLFEEVLVSYCGEYREGNLFCLRVSDAPYVIDYITKAIKNKEFTKLDDNDIRYCSINLMSLHKYGSLEFRAMRSTPDLSVVINWINLLLCVKKYASTLTTPKNMIERFSARHPNDLLQEVFGEFYGLLLLGDTKRKLRSGMRNAQEIAYCVDWSDYCKDLDDNIFFGVYLNNPLHDLLPL